METAIALLAFALLSVIGLVGPDNVKLKKENAALKAQMSAKCPPPSPKVSFDVIKASVDRDQAVKSLYREESK